MNSSFLFLFSIKKSVEDYLHIGTEEMIYFIDHALKTEDKLNEEVNRIRKSPAVEQLFAEIEKRVSAAEASRKVKNFV